MRVFRRTPLVSVVLASYNHAPFVTTAVRIVTEQGIDELEIIVVDDGSTDGTPDQVERIGDPRVQLVRLNEGGSPTKPAAPCRFCSNGSEISSAVPLMYNHVSRIGAAEPWCSLV